jgi:hypothetical protein
MRIKQVTRPDQESTRIGPKIAANKRLVVLVEHKGIQYQVVQTANPTGFKWTVHLDVSRTKTGVSFKGQRHFPRGARHRQSRERVS